jgi:hypothetical protein
LKPGCRGFFGDFELLILFEERGSRNDRREGLTEVNEDLPELKWALEKGDGKILAVRRTSEIQPTSRKPQ